MAVSLVDVRLVDETWRSVHLWMADGGCLTVPALPSAQARAWVAEELRAAQAAASKGCERRRG